MKTLSPTERVCSAGSVRRWTVLIAVASIGCLPLFSALADQTDHNNKGGSNKAPSSHQGGSHGGNVSRAPTVHQGGNHTASAPSTSSHQVAPSSHQRTYHASTNRTAVSHQNAAPHHNVVSHQNTVSHHNVVSHENGASHKASTKTATSHQAGTSGSVASKTEHNRVTSSQGRNTSRTLKEGATSNSHASLYQKNNASREARNHQTATTQERNTTRAPSKRDLQTRINTAAKASSFNRSLTATSARGLMGHRLTQISNRQWSSHGPVFAAQSDPQRGFWFQRGGYYWRCNFWGAHSYCDRLIVLGFPAGLCWAWYDDICWGNIVIGMPVALVDYYYPTPVQTEDTDYNGEPATVYYYATYDGQYRQVTVVDGDVVDVEIVSQIS